MKPTALILQATGTNRDLDVAEALEQAGAATQLAHINQMRAKTFHWQEYQLLVLAGGFSYADSLGAGKLLALDLQSYFADEVQAFVAAGKPVVGICNGFQALVKAGILPGRDSGVGATLTFNTRGQFECRWVTLQPVSTHCVWTNTLAEPIYCPVAHGEGNFITASDTDYRTLCAQDQVALIYAAESGQAAGGQYPINPNGSVGDIAGICNPQGNVLGLMPHPENHIYAHQHPRWTRGESAGSGLALFRNGVAYAASSQL